MGHHLGYTYHVLVGFTGATAKTVMLIDLDSISFGCAHIGGQKSYNYNTASWRVPWGLQMIPAVFLNVGMLFLPESPRWLARKDRWEEAHGVLAKVHGKGDPNHPFVTLEMQDIREMCEFERRYKSVTYFDLFKPKMINRTMIGLWMQIWSQLTGMNVMSKFPGFRLQSPYSFPVSVLYHLCFPNGGVFWKFHAPRVFHSVYHQCGHDSAGLALAGQVGPSTNIVNRRASHGYLDVRQCRHHGSPWNCSPWRN